MAELSKIALARLRAKQAVPPTPGTPASPSIVEHPDANMLAAFAERALSDRERTEVLNHLSECRDCREVVSLMVPPSEMVEPARVAVARGWNPLRMLRWGSLVAALGVVTIVVISHPDFWRRNSEATSAKPPVLSAANSARPAPPSESLPSTPPLVLSAPSQQSAETRQKLEASESRPDGFAQLKKSGGPRRDEEADKQAMHLQAQQQATVMAYSQPLARMKAENAPLGGAERKESLGHNAVSGLARSAPVAAPPPPAPAVAAGEPLAAAGGTVKAPNAADRAEAPRSVNETGRVTADATSPQRNRSTTESVTVTAEAPQLERESAGLGGFRGNLMSKDDKSATVWSISPEGKVVRSIGRTKTLETFDFAPGVRFQAVAASGDDVWAGGESGSLYHSIDGGASWALVPINVKGSPMMEAITAIEIHDTKHLTVATTSGIVWVTKDGGKHWHKQP